MSELDEFMLGTDTDDEDLIVPNGSDLESDDDPLEDLPVDQRIILRKDILDAAANLEPSEARYLVSLYYQFQEKRKGAANQKFALKNSGQPFMIMDWTTLQVKRIESSMYRLLDHYTANEPTGMGAWAREHVGIGPAISAALLSRIDVTKASTAGAVWRYAGLDPRITWYGRERSKTLVEAHLGNIKNAQLTADTLVPLSIVTDRRVERLVAMATNKTSGKLTKEDLVKGLSKVPWDKFLKLICWRMAQSFTYQAGRPNCVYGILKAEYKARIIKKNEEGGYAERAAQILESKHFGDDTAALRYYKSGKLPPGHIEAMAKRWVAKLFLAHWFEEAYRRHYHTEPPLPYAVAHMGHTHIVHPDGTRTTVAPKT